MAKQFNNSYDDLLKDMEANNIKFSDYDLELAKNNPDAGRSLYTQKVAYGQATTDKERQKANDEANRIRQQYGGYSGGTDGTGYTLTQTYAPPASEYVSQYQDDIDNWTEKLTNYSPYESRYDDEIDNLLAQLSNPDPYQGTYQQDINNLLNQIQNRDPYQSQYQGDIENLLDQIMNREEFSYNPAADPSYQAYSEKYRNEGNRAVQNVLGNAAAMNGGQISSYGLTAAQQAQNAYAAEMSDLIPQLRQMAYETYLDEGAELRNNLSALMSQDDREYGRYIDDLNLDQSILNTLLEQDSMDYNRHQNDYANELNRWQMNYGVDRYALSDQRYENELAQELERYERELALEQEHYDEGLAWDTENRDYTRGLEKAKTLASVGDFSGFRALGYSEDEIASLSNAYAQKNGRGYQTAVPVAGRPGQGEEEPNDAPAAPAEGNGASYSSIWSRARTMYDSGKSEEEIAAFLDGFSEHQLTDAGLEKIILSLNLGGAREV